MAKDDNDGGVDKLVGPGGQSLIKEPKIIVLKAPKDVKFQPGFLAALSKQSGCDVITLPMDSEFMMGRIAKEHLEYLHTGIHAILGIKE